MADDLAIARVYWNTGDERDDFPYAVSLDDHEPMALFTERPYAVGFAGTLIDILGLGAVAVADLTKPERTSQDVET